MSAAAVLLLAALIPSAAHPADAGPDLVRRLEAALSVEPLQGARASVFVRRLDDGAELFAHEADAQLVPASNMKIITTAAALRQLGPDFQFETEAWMTPSAKGKPGDLVLVGFGDPSLVPERLWYLATRIVYAGVREVGDLVIDDAYFAGPRLIQGYDQDDSDDAYMAPTGAVSVGFNAILVHVLPGAVAGAAARVMIDPASDYAVLESAVTTTSRGRTSLNAEVTPKGDRSRVRVTGRIALGDPGRSIWRRIDNPPVFAGELLKTTLTQLGVKVRGKVRLAPRPTTATLVTKVESPHLTEIVSALNKHSNNFMAEQLALALGAARSGAPATWDKAKAALEAFLTEDVGLAPGSYTIGNASGLNDVNRFSARQLVAVLAWVRRQPTLAPEFVTSLAVAGSSGTLTSRMRSSEAAHLLRAKTGTLSKAIALSGYVDTRGGQTLAFSIIVNDYRSTVGDVWRVQDEIGAALASLGASGASRMSIGSAEGATP